MPCRQSAQLRITKLNLNQVLRSTTAQSELKLMILFTTVHILPQTVQWYSNMATKGILQSATEYFKQLFWRKTSRYTVSVPR